MIGLEKYIEKHGRHFTESLALQVTNGRYNGQQLWEAAQKKVYYNVTGSTLGDMVYLVNKIKGMNYHFNKSRSSCITHALHIIEDYSFYGGVVFADWLDGLKESKEDFDFTPYI